MKSKGDKSAKAAQGAVGVLRTNDVVAGEARASDAFVAAMPYNSIKELEYGHDNGAAPPPGVTIEPDSSALTASTTTEETGTAKTGSAARLGTNATVASLERVRVDASDRPLTTNQGVRIGDNQNTLKAGLRGPSLLEDFILRGKITHFDHERIPERIVHARGSGAHGYFEAYDALTKYTRAAAFAEKGKISLVWDEAVKISGADPDFHRRDLWEAIESGEFPEWELGLQIFSEEQAQGFSFDVLDSTKIVPEELVPLTPVGRMVLNRNPDNFFAETEQVAFCTAHIVPGIDFSNDPLLAGRIHSYADTQITRLGGPNFHEIPINSPLAPVQNNQRDGMHRQALHRGRVSYEPNSLAGGCPFQAGTTGFVSFPEALSDDKVRGKPEKFAEHYAQATLFFDSQTPVERAHIAAAFRFELSKVGVPAIRERMLSSLVNVSRELAAEVAAGLGMEVPDAMPKAIADPEPPEVTVSPALSLMALPGECGIRTRQIAILVEKGVHHASLVDLYGALTDAGAVVHFVGPRVGMFVGDSGEKVEADKSMENSPGVLCDALVLPDGSEAVQALLGNGHTMAFVKDLFRHCKTILALGAGREVLEKAGFEPAMDEDPGILLAEGADAAETASAFIDAIAAYRHPSRDEYCVR